MNFTINDGKKETYKEYMDSWPDIGELSDESYKKIAKLKEDSDARTDKGRLAKRKKKYTLRKRL